MLLILLLASSVITLMGEPPVSADRQSEPAEIAFDEFSRLSPEARTEKFRTLSAAGKAYIKRIQSQRWLAVNRSRLSAQQVAATEAAIAFVTPEIYSRTNDPAIVKRGEQVARDVSLRVGSGICEGGLSRRPGQVQRPVHVA